MLILLSRSSSFSCLRKACHGESEALNPVASPPTVMPAVPKAFFSTLPCLKAKMVVQCFKSADLFFSLSLVGSCLKFCVVSFLQSIFVFADSLKLSFIA